MTLDDIGKGHVIKAPMICVYSYLTYESDNELTKRRARGEQIFITDRQGECDSRNMFLDAIITNTISHLLCSEP